MQTAVVGAAPARDRQARAGRPHGLALGDRRLSVHGYIDLAICSIERLWTGLAAGGARCWASCHNGIASRTLASAGFSLTAGDEDSQHECHGVFLPEA